MTVAAYLYDTEGHDREVEVSDELLASLGPERLLWIDVDQRSESDLKQIAETLEIDPKSLDSLLRPGELQIENYGRYTQISVETAPATLSEEDAGTETGNGHRGTRLDFLVSDKWLLTVHDGKIDFVEAFRTRDKAETTVGTLSPYDFAASLLDAHLEAFFEEVARIEAMIDRLDEQALVKPSSSLLLGRMVALRRRVSRLRTLLSHQRGVFYALSRPDLRGTSDSDATPHFQVLVGRFERAIDEVEHARDLVVGSFELFSSRTAEQTNELVKVLTYLTAVIGLCAAVAGLLGMNFKADIFETADQGFYTTVIALVLVVITATLVARWRNWI